MLPLVVVQAQAVAAVALVADPVLAIVVVVQAVEVPVVADILNS